MAKKNGILGKVLLILILTTLAIAGYLAYTYFLKNNVELGEKKYDFIYIKSNSDFKDLLSELNEKGIIKNQESFEWTARKLELDKNIIPGKYRIDSKMSNRSIIKMLKNGKQEFVKLHFNSQIRNRKQFIQYVSEKLEIEKDELESFFDKEPLTIEIDYINTDNFMCCVSPGKMELSWATNLSQLIELISKRHQDIWNEERVSKAKKMGYTIPEVITLASIVQGESHIKSEQQKIAGVYINRLKTGMRLQADPTIVFANEKFDAQRVLAADKEIDSPYNTYKYKGLPPGPIALVSTSVIDAVLNFEKHNYTYFCAKPDFSGYSDFTNDYNVHLKNAKAYQEALNKRGIMK